VGFWRAVRLRNEDLDKHHHATQLLTMLLSIWRTEFVRAKLGPAILVVVFTVGQLLLANFFSGKIQYGLLEFLQLMLTGQVEADLPTCRFNSDWQGRRPSWLVASSC
jgi:hypothetical protein